MSWHFSRAQVAAFLEENFWVGEPSVALKSNPTPQAFLSKDRMKAFSTRSLSGMTFAPLTENRGEELLTWFLAGFPVKTLVPLQQPKGKDWTERKADSGNTSQELLAKYDQASHSWKIPQDLLQTDSTVFLGRWPKWGTMRNGACLEQTIVGLPIKEKERGFWHGTPRCADKIGASNKWSPKWRNPTSHFRWFLHVQFSQGRPMTYPSPECMEAVMGWPITWTELRPLEMDKFQSWQRQHGLSC